MQAKYQLHNIVILSITDICPYELNTPFDKMIDELCIELTRSQNTSFSQEQSEQQSEHL